MFVESTRLELASRYPANRLYRFAGTLPDLPDLSALRARVEAASSHFLTAIQKETPRQKSWCFFLECVDEKDAAIKVRPAIHSTL